MAASTAPGQNAGTGMEALGCPGGGKFQGKSSHEQPFGARGMACGSGDLLFWGYQCPETLHRMRPPAALGFELALKPRSSSPWLGQGTWVYVNRAEPESSCFQKASSKASTGPSPSCSTNLGGERRLPGRARPDLVLRCSWSRDVGGKIPPGHAAAALLLRPGAAEPQGAVSGRARSSLQLLGE